MLRNWHNTLFLGPMPGTEAPLQEWLDELDEAGITAIVCLNPEGEISLLSPEYGDWRRAQSATPAPEQPTLELFDLPIDDGCAPTSGMVEQFWTIARNVAERCRADERTFIHCTAGRGRTGMFGVAVLMTLGYSLVDAATELYEVGSYPETDQQDAFLASSLMLPQPQKEPLITATGLADIHRLKLGIQHVDATLLTEINVLPSR